jgi:diketogulonate reductase-like aldo/keto reductase
MESKELGKTGVKIPVLGMGTWGIGGLSGRQIGGEDEAVRALKNGLESGMRFIDTAEMYGRGHSEEVVAEAVKGHRDEVFIATKVSAEHLAHDDVLKACEASLRRLKTNYIDLYQVHWPNNRVPIPETMKAMERLVTEGKVRYIGVSNFSVRQTSEAQEALSKPSLASNQVEYSLLERSIEADLLPYAQKEHITIIAYTPVAKGQFAHGGRGKQWGILDEVASRYGKTRTQVALNWLIVQDEVMAIPKAVSPEHIKENLGATGWALSREDIDLLNRAFA